MSPLRALLRHPAYVATSLAAVTLAVGANLVVFSFVNVGAALKARSGPLRLLANGFYPFLSPTVFGRTR